MLGSWRPPHAFTGSSWQERGGEEDRGGVWQSATDILDWRTVEQVTKLGLKQSTLLLRGGNTSFLGVAGDTREKSSRPDLRRLSVSCRELPRSLTGSGG